MFPLKKYLQNVIAEFPKSLIVFMSDLFFTLLAVFFVVLINSEKNISSFENFSDGAVELLFIIVIQSIAYRAFGLYRGVWRFASLPDLMRIIKACLAGTCVLAATHFFLNAGYLPISSFPLFCLFAICLLSGARLSYRWHKDYHKKFNADKKVIVIGAGTAGENILRELKRKSNKDFMPVGLIDDDAGKQGLEIHGIRVLGFTKDLPAIVEARNIDLILIAIPRANTVQMRRIVNLCEQSKVPYRTLPSFNDIAAGKTNITNIREVSVEDLLSRDPIEFDRERLRDYITNKKILVTGAGGSIGSELCRKIAEIKPAAIILIDSNEYNLFKIQTELQQFFPELKLHFYLVSITNQAIIHDIMTKYAPDFVFHAAAYKHVPLLEPLSRIAIENNIFGTKIVAEAAIASKVKKFILVSTDKAVNPENVMGATKRCAEVLCQYFNQNSKTEFITVRFGNVLGSTGSVIPIFKEQITNGGPVTVTHPDMERYFMTITEAAQLIIQTVTLNNPGALYVLDMGEPIKIQYLAEQMIKLSGHIPNVDIKISYSGLRPGEKINEELFYPNENVNRIENSKILHVDVPKINFTGFSQHLDQLKQACQLNDVNLKTFLFELANAKYFAPLFQEDVVETFGARELFAVSES
jgi:FlaA1/EpsC-like NDP-sugar epimerase